MLTSELREVLVEEDCDHNAKKQTPGCPRPTPGKAGGGCAFDGAFSSLVPITDAAHIVHGPIGCVGNAWNNRGAKSSGPLMYKNAFATNINNNDVVFGGEKKLYQAIKQIIKTHNPPAVFVYQTCVTAMIGDDLGALCKAVSEKTGVPVIPVESPGFIGSKNFGNRLSGDAVLRQVIGTQEPKAEHPFNFNIIGEFNIAGEFWEVAPIFDQLGIRLICTLSGDARYHQVAMMHKAQVNMMVCSRALLNVARRLRELYGIPYFEGSFYGAQNFSNSLRQLVEYFGDATLKEKTEALIAHETAKLEPQLCALKAKLKGKKALLYTGGVKSWSLVGALQELGIEVIATGTKKSTEEDKARIKELMGEEAEMITDGSAPNLLKLYHEAGADLLMAGGRNQYTALKAKLPFVHVNQERDLAFAGYSGFLRFAKQLVFAIESPAYAWAKRPFGAQS
ncbi:MAG: nitrogenase iron-molybdenum cofactor biosynthesis protein NifE [Candidatus Lambdaproteobacteria bacterium RIFOXYD12_FULL_49_8]|uniref:Nitrogenase iron-molybdenum cofactor biosynthesis protein NifE n=1 Tax=Candidatus Lambdaproteobacteria bacterium RIFOXYD2_FULL_50_16 TaxID=1817772 RepID=A0A1F6G8R8_9PROT|nr:MAG: nitrogenase iron-molybdenum cofactor biosynthesis protein NifE [Candidatus Lambdaproteobacteria bacterium RIFOXYD2_FULL_50_16]OGG97344.1 MAG: nitrogenase iron-molybdenum cofactor biosynthesis protein NifE [Candidatus Lambdaproteobacteria bacterium RIFOXYD12_FULL_49_8]